MTPSGPAADGRAPGIVAVLQATLRRHRLLRFLVAGGVNTAVGYGLFLLALALMPTTMSALVVSTILAVLFNFVSTGTYVFGRADPRRLWRFVAVYGVVFAYNAAGLHWLERAGIAPAIGGLLLLPGAVLISYGLQRSFVFGGSGR